MVSRANRLCLAAALAAGFVIFRLGYALLFNGLTGSQTLVELPSFSLPGPFRQVQIGGSVSLDGILRNIETALPFALAILIFGALSSLIELRHLRLLGAKFPKLSWLATSLGVGFAALPHLAQLIGELGRAMRLRRERRIALLVPLLERTVKRAIQTGLELARSRPETRVGKLELVGFSAMPIRNANLSFNQGDLVLITGPTGSGKTTILRALAGELSEDDNRDQQGQLLFGGEEVAGFAAASQFSFLVPQLPQAMVDNLEMTHREFTKDLSTTCSALSHGESYRVALDVALSRSPGLLLLDEPSAALDRLGLTQLLAKVAELRSRGVIVVVAEHRSELWAEAANRQLQIVEGQLREGVYRPTLPVFDRLPTLLGDDRAIEIQLAEVRARELLLEQVELQLRLGEAVAVVGPNGSGKSSLLQRLAWPAPQEMRIHGVHQVGPNPGRVALVPENLENYFVAGSLIKELRRADRVARVESGLTQRTLEAILGRELVELDRHPLDLSVGFQLALAVSMQLSHKPALLLLDEPVQGLDPATREMMAETLRCVQETGCALIFATHDREFATSLANRILEISNRALVPLAEVNAP